MVVETGHVVVTVTELTPESGPDLIEAWTLVRRETDAEVNPGDPPYPAAELTAEVFVPNEATRYRAWLAHLDGEPVGEAVLALETDLGNEHLGGAEWLAVRPDFRGRGVGRALARTLLSASAAEDRSTVLAWVPSGPAAEVGATAAAWATRLGLIPATTERCSRVRVADLDRDLLRRWLDDAVAPGLGYRLVRYHDRCAPEHRAALVAANAAMQDAPTDDLDYTIPTFTSVGLDRREEQCDRKMITIAGTLALAPDGSAAGYSAIYVSRHRPQLAHQGDTGVVAAHRGNGIGKWLKAANLAWAEEIVPGFDVIETFNAESNPWMLQINEAMGFRPHVGYTGFQGDLVAVRALLG